MMAPEPMFALESHCQYYRVTDAQTGEVIAVVEAGDKAEASQFVSALCHLLSVVPGPDIRELGDVMPPNGVPVFRLQYFKAMQARAEEEGRQPGTTRH